MPQKKIKKQINSQFLNWKKRPHCSGCGREFSIPYLWCPDCNKLIIIPSIQGPNLPLKSSSFSSKPSIWDFSAFLPDFPTKISLDEGNTPISTIQNFPELQGLQMKLEFRNPTGSFRDRASALMISDALSKRKAVLANASTGSYSISLAAYCAKAQLDSLSIVPEQLEMSKIEQITIYGSKVKQQGKSLEEAEKKAKNLLKSENIYSPLPHENLLMIEGQKTIGLEIALKLHDVKGIIAPYGSGSLIYSIYRGLLDAQTSGWIKNLPEIHSVSLLKSHDMHLVESLEVNKATKSRFSKEIEQILLETHGSNIQISGTEMIQDALDLAKYEGIFIEPASGSVISAAKQLIKERDIDLSKYIVILSGSGINAMNIFASRLRKVKKVVWGVAKKSTTRFEILNLISEHKATYAPTIQKSLTKSQTLQSVYLHLKILESDGFIRDLNPKMRKKNYELTPTGKKLLEKMKELMELRKIET
ncbi:MAG: pyridoxal-phosphate dependent enzyme [Promethearchaeota archaeon]